MPLVLADRVRDTTTTTGTGTVTLSGTAPTGYQNFSVIGNGNTTYYTINAGSQWEVGIGTYSSTGPTLSRDTVLESSNANALVNFSAGVKDVFVTYPSDKSVIQDASGNVGIGVSSPGTRLDVLSSSDTPANFRSAGANTYIRFINSVNTEGYIGYLSSDLTFWTTSERMRINSSGNVGVGVTPLTRLDVATSGGSRIRTDTSNSLLVTQTITNAAANAYVTSRTDAFDYQIYTGGSEKARIDSSGNVGIGVSSPGTRLQVADVAAPSGFSSTAVRVTRSNYGADFIGYIDQGVGHGAIISTVDNGTPTERMRIDSAGFVGIGTSAPGVALDVAGDAVRVTRAVFPAAFLGRQGNGTLASPTATVSGNQIVALAGSGHNGSAYTATPSAVMRYLALENFTATANGAAILFETTPIGSSTAARAERMRIDGSGNVGIGTTSPASTFEVVSNASASIFSTNYSDNAAGGNYIGRKGRGTSSSPTAALTDDQLVTVLGRGYTSSGAFSGNVGAIGIHAAENFTSTNNGTYIAFATTPTGATGRTERMRIDSAGNVGIGNTNPTTKLWVGSSGGGSGTATPDAICIGNTFANTAGDPAKMKLRLFDENGSNLYGFGVSANLMETHVPSGASMAWYTGGSERMRITAAGDVGIGTSSPSQPLHISVPAAGVFVNSSGQGTASLWMAGNSGSASLTQFGGELRFNTGGSANTAASGATERARITSGGNVGIGNTDPGYRLDITAGDTTAGLGYAMRLRSNATAAAATLQFTNNGVTAQNGLIACTDTGLITVQGDGASSAIAFRTNGSERARIDSSGNLLVGTTAPLGGNTSSEYRVTTADSWPLTLNANNRGLLIRNSAASSGFYAYFEYNNGPNNNGSISWSGGATSYNTTSDARIKDNIVDAPEAGDLIDGIKVRSWDFKADGAHWRYGMVAQELLEVAPEAVSVPADEAMMMGVDYSKLVPMLIKEVQSLRARVAQLEGK